MKLQRAVRLERLVDANPRLEHNGTWLSFDCPIHPTESDSGEGPVAPWCRVAIPLRAGDPAQGWDHTGDTFETLTLSPSIARRSQYASREAAIASGCLPEHVDDSLLCALHIFIKNGAIEFCGDSK